MQTFAVEFHLSYKGNSLESIATIHFDAETFDKNRDGIEKQVGHKLIVNFKKSIVGDSIEYITDNKTDGYNVIKGKKKLDVGNLEILKGGRGKSSKKSRGIDMVKNSYIQLYSVTVE